MTRNEIIAAAKAGKSLRGAHLMGANLTGAVLRGADLREANLTGADLRGADLRWADLTGADLRWADLTGADLTGADLRGADLRWADLREADLTSTRLRGAYLLGVSIWGQAKFTDDQLTKANWSVDMKFDPTNTQELLAKREPFIVFPTLTGLTAFDYPAREADPENPGLTPCLSSRYAVYSQGVLIVIFDKMDDTECVYVCDTPDPKTQAAITQVLQDSGWMGTPVPLSADNLSIVLKNGSAGLAVMGG